VRDAVVMLGERRLRAWVTLMLLSGGHEGSDEQFNIAMTRARMAELMALAVEPRLVDQAFTVGLVSALDLLLQVPLQTVVDGLSLSSEPEEALLGHTGVLGDILVDVLSWEVGGGDLEMRSRLGAADMEQCYMQALAWSTDVCGVLDFTN
jgi:EAL and modified HD-GYP domain-containing signal transduction protein